MEKMANELDEKNITPFNMNLQTFKLKWNSKNPSSEWNKVNLPTAKRSRSLENMKLLKDEHNNFGVICGKANDLTIVDLDFYDHGDETFDPRMSKFHQVFGDDFIKKFNTFAIKTGSGGFHLYFKYIQKIKQTSDKSSSIDIRNDGGYVVAPYSNISGKRYEVIHETDIKPMPQELVDWLLNNIYPAKKIKKVRNPVVKVKRVNEDTKKEEEVEELFDDIDLGVYKFAVPKKLVEQCLCKGLPDKYFHDYAYWLKYTTAMKTLDMKDLWDKYNKIRCKKDKNKTNLLTNWDGIVDHNKLDMLGHCLNESKVEGSSTILSYFKYKPTECHTETPTDFINRDKLGYDAIEEFSDKHKILVFRSDTGTGKTTTMKHYLKNNNKRFLSIVSRISLGEEQTAVFREHGIDCEYHQEIQDEMDEYNQNAMYYNEYMDWRDCEGRNIVITIDSLCKMVEWENFYGYTIYLDEYNSLIEHLITSPTCSSKRSSIFWLLRKIIEEADLVVGTDADISDNCLMIFKQLGLEYRFIDNQYKHNNNVKATEIRNFDEFMKKLMKEPKFIVCADSKTIVDIMGHKMFEDNVKVITSETSGRVNLDDYDRVLFSPKIVYGLDSVMKRPVFAYFCQMTITPVAMVQQICRCRNITDITFMFEDRGVSYYKYHDIDEIKDEVKQLHKLSLEHFTTSGDLKDDYLDLYARFEYNYDCYNTNKKAHFIQILKKRGVKISLKLGVESDTKGKIDDMANMKDMKQKDLEELCKEWRETIVDPCLQKRKEDYEEELEDYIGEPEKYAEDITDIKEALDNNVEEYREWEKKGQKFFPEWIWRKNEILKIPYGSIHEYSELFFSPNKLESHFLACNFFFKTQIELMEEINKSEDFGVKKLKCNKGKLILMLKYLQMTNKDFYKFRLPNEEDIKPLTKEQNEKYTTEYNLVYRVRRKDPIDLTNKHQAYIHYIDLYRKICSGLIKKKQTTKNGENIINYNMEIDCLDYHRKVVRHRNTEIMPMDMYV